MRSWRQNKDTFFHQKTKLLNKEENISMKINSTLSESKYISNMKKCNIYLKHTEVNCSV